MENRIELKFGKLVVDLTGNSFGRKTFKQQVEKSFDENNVNIIVLPECIDDVGSSFVQGMYYLISEKYGKEKALSMMKFDGAKTSVLEKIKKAIETYGI